jgi:hypothetical protein
MNASAASFASLRERPLASQVFAHALASETISGELRLDGECLARAQRAARQAVLDGDA